MFVTLADVQPQDGADPAQIQAVLESIKRDGEALSRNVYASASELNARKLRIANLRRQLSTMTGRPVGVVATQPIPPFNQIASKVKQATVRATTGASQFSSMADLSGGAQSWFFGQIVKIDDFVKQGRWNDVLAELMRITPETSGKLADPVGVLMDPALVEALKVHLDKDVYPAQVNRARLAPAQLALDKMSRRLRKLDPMPDPNQLPPDDADLMTKAAYAMFDQSAYDANASSFMGYVQSHQPGQSNFFTKTIRETARISNQLDTYVPGWSVVIDMVAPAVPILAPLALAIKAFPVVGTLASNVAMPLISGPGVAAVKTGASEAGFGANLIFKPVSDTAIEVAKAASPFKFTVSKIGYTAVKTDGSILDKLEAASMEALAAISLTLEIGGMIVSGGAFFGAVPALTALELAAVETTKAAITALKTGITLAKAQDAARALKHAADVAATRARLEIARAQAEEQDILRQIEAIKAEQRRLADEAKRKKSTGVAATAATLTSNPVVLASGVAAFVMLGAALYLVMED